MPPSDSDNDSLRLVGTKTVRWTSGNKRDRETRVLSAYTAAESKKLLLDSFAHCTDPFEDDEDDAEENISRHLIHTSKKTYKLGRRYSLSRSKNSCIFSGKGSTFNRFLFVSRQTLRGLTRFGLVSGLVSGKRG